MFVMWHKLFGRKVIVCKRLRDGEVWHSVIRIDPWGEKFSYRYTSTKIGGIKLNEQTQGLAYNETCEAANGKKF